MIYKQPADVIMYATVTYDDDRFGMYALSRRHELNQDRLDALTDYVPDDGTFFETYTSTKDVLFSCLNLTEPA